VNASRGAVLGRLRSAKLGDRARAHHFEDELVLEAAQHLLGSIGLDQTGAEVFLNCLYQPLQDRDAHVRLDLSEIDDIAALFARNRGHDLLQVRASLLYRHSTLPFCRAANAASVIGPPRVLKPGAVLRRPRWTAGADDDARRCSSRDFSCKSLQVFDEVRFAGCDQFADLDKSKPLLFLPVINLAFCRVQEFGDFLRADQQI
jgi:hypothetical protein